MLALAITASHEHAVGEQRIQRTIVYRNEVIEHLQLSDKPEITVIVNYKKDATTPMPVVLGWFGRRERKIAELTKQLPATQGLTITECRGDEP